MRSNLYVKLGLLVYCLIVPVVGFTASQLHAGGSLKGDYVRDIKNSPTKRHGYYNISMPPSSTFILRQSVSGQNFHHNLLIEAGKIRIFKECLVDMEQDPTENSCRAVWAYI